jgi:hypothetical protein
MKKSEAKRHILLANTGNQNDEADVDVDAEDEHDDCFSIEPQLKTNPTEFHLISTYR